MLSINPFHNSFGLYNLTYHGSSCYVTTCTLPIMVLGGQIYTLSTTSFLLEFYLVHVIYRIEFIYIYIYGITVLVLYVFKSHNKK